MHGIWHFNQPCQSEDVAQPSVEMGHRGGRESGGKVSLIVGWTSSKAKWEVKQHLLSKSARSKRFKKEAANSDNRQQDWKRKKQERKDTKHMPSVKYPWKCQIYIRYIYTLYVMNVSWIYISNRKTFWHCNRQTYKIDFSVDEDQEFVYFACKLLVKINIPYARPYKSKKTWKTCGNSLMNTNALGCCLVPRGCRQT